MKRVVLCIHMMSSWLSEARALPGPPVMFYSHRLRPFLTACCKDIA